MRPYLSIGVLVAGLAVSELNNRQILAEMQASGGAQPGGAAAQGQGVQAGPPRAPLQTFDTTKPVRLDVVEAKARYKVQEQLVGVNFGSEAVGTTDAVTGTLVVAPDGSIGSQSRLTVDLRTLKSDQEARDNYLRTRTLETDKFPMFEFVPKRAQGLPAPVPSPPQAQALGFQLIGNIMLHGVTKEATWNVVATLRGPIVAGRATTTLVFSDFSLTKPSVPLLLSADDKIQIEVEFRLNRTAL